MWAALRMFVSSKTKHREDWKRLRVELAKEGVCQVTASWLDQGDGVPLGEVWEGVMRDLRGAGAMLLWAGEGEDLKGSLVELGMALGFGVPVYAAVPAGYAERYTALHHPGVWLWEGEPHQGLRQAQSRALNHVLYGTSLAYEEGTWVKLAGR